MHTQSIQFSMNSLLSLRATLTKNLRCCFLSTFHVHTPSIHDELPPCASSLPVQRFRCCFLSTFLCAHAINSIFNELHPYASSLHVHTPSIQFSMNSIHTLPLSLCNVNQESQMLFFVNISMCTCYQFNFQ